MKLFLTICTGLLLLGCSSDPSQNTPGSRPRDNQSSSIVDEIKKAEILKGFEVFVNRFGLNAEQANTFTTSKGSKISIPAKAFKHTDGKPVTGKVELTFKEYHTPGEIIASGIPMVYTTPSGEKQQFESAGMFDIRAYQEGEELELAANKEIDVKLATSDPGTYNFYQFQENQSNWEIKDTECKPVQNTELAKQTKTLADLENNPVAKPKKPIAYKPSDKLFDIFINLNKNPEFKPIHGVMWKYIGTDPKSDPGNNPAVFQKEYEFISMTPAESEELTYNLFFVSKKDTLKVEAAPVFKGVLMTKKNAEFTAKMKEFNNTLISAEKIRKQLKRETDLLREFSISQLGIYNYDRQFKDPGAIPMFASFDFGKKVEDENFVNVYLIPAQKNVVIKYTQETFSAFAINPREYNKLIAVLPDNQMYYLSDKDIKSMQLNASSQGKKVLFKMKPYSGKVTTPEKTDEILASL